MSSPEIRVRFAALDDLAWCVAHDDPIGTDIVQRKIEWEEYVLAEWGGERVGFVRLEYLWSEIPFLAMIRVQEDCQGQGVGRAILAFVEAHLREQGHTVLLSSSQVNEAEPQAWHRHMGFVECGILTGLNPGGVGEVFFRKPL